MQNVYMLLVFVLLWRHLRLSWHLHLQLQSGKAQQHTFAPLHTQTDGVVCTRFSLKWLNVKLAAARIRNPSSPNADNTDMQHCSPLPLSLSQLGSRHSSCLQLGLLLLLWLLLRLLAWLLHHLFLLQRSCFSRWGKNWHGSWQLLRLTAEVAFLFCFSGSSLCWLSWLLQTLGGTLVFPPLAVLLFLQSQWLVEVLRQHVCISIAGNITDKTF